MEHAESDAEKFSRMVFSQTGKIVRQEAAFDDVEALAKKVFRHRNSKDPVENAAVATWEKMKSSLRSRR
jgi:hypothetical protein